MVFEPLNLGQLYPTMQQKFEPLMAMILGEAARLCSVQHVIMVIIGSFQH